ncbi:MAG: hypothetical protein IBJ11_10345 [Phycisphaerales bacterium]|nr:hypothetical protein [Phycisphaerales bacterium]
MSPRLQPIVAGSAYFAIVFACGFVLGALREVLIRPVAGEALAIALEMPLILAASFLVCRWAVRRFAIAPRPGPRAAMGLWALALLLAAELALGWLLRGLTPAQSLARSATAAGALSLAGYLAFAAMPAALALIPSRDA